MFDPITDPNHGNANMLTPGMRRAGQARRMVIGVRNGGATCPPPSINFV